MKIEEFNNVKFILGQNAQENWNIFDEARNILLNNHMNYENLKSAYMLNFIYLVIGISLFYFSYLKARIKGTLINMGE